MDALELLHGRVSVRADDLDEPAPTDAEIETLIRAAVTAPDHGGLQPWSFIVIRGSARERLGEVFADAARQRDPAIDEATLAKLRAKPQRAPLVIAVAARIDPDNPKIPPIEQILSAGAAAQQLQLAANALGFASIWLTGESAHDATVREALGLGFDDRLVGFVNIGTPARVPERPQRPDPARFLHEWQQPLQLETL